MSKKKGWIIAWDNGANTDLGAAADGPMLKGNWTPLNVNGNVFGESMPTETANHGEAPGRGDGQWMPHTQTRIDPAVGGAPGERYRLGWSTGFAPRSVTTQPFLGGIVTAPRNMLGRSSYGPVGKDNYHGKLLAGVRQQAADFLPDTAAIARSFVTRAGTAGIRAEMQGNGS